jgi:hypothetical protein
MLLMQSLKVDDITYKRLNSLLIDYVDLKKQDLDMDDLLNELIDNYQEAIWGTIGANAGGG